MSGACTRLNRGLGGRAASQSCHPRAQPPSDPPSPAVSVSGVSCSFSFAWLPSDWCGDEAREDAAEPLPSDSAGGWRERGACRGPLSLSCTLWPPLPAPLPCYLLRTCSSSSLSRCSWDSSCLLWSSRICMRVSRRLLCCRRMRASARSSSLRGSGTSSGEPVAKLGDSTASSCCHFKRLSSPCRILRDSLGQHHRLLSGDRPVADSEPPLSELPTCFHPPGAPGCAPAPPCRPWAGFLGPAGCPRALGR